MSTEMVELTPLVVFNEKEDIVDYDLHESLVRRVSGPEYPTPPFEPRQNKKYGSQYHSNTKYLAKSLFHDNKLIDDEEKRWVEWIRSVRIKIAKIALTESVGSDSEYDYFKSEFGMNIIVPKGRINELRLKGTLWTYDTDTDGDISRIMERIKSNPSSIDDYKIELYRDLIVLDGFPKDQIEEKHIIKGKIRVCLNKAFKFIPILDRTISDIVDVQFEPWEFHLGLLRQVNIDFSGGLTSEPEWVFKKKAIQNDLRVAITFRKPKAIRDAFLSIEAGWIYDPGFFKKADVGSDYNTITLI